VVLEDMTQQSGLDKFHHRSGTPEKSTIIEVPGSGVALLDYDNDGWLDIYPLNGSRLAALKGKEPAPRAMLFHNNRDATFTDVTGGAGVANERWGFGVAVGDYDNDGWQDIYVANFGQNRLCHNNHDGTFTDVAEKAGVALSEMVRRPELGRLRSRRTPRSIRPGYGKFDPDVPQSCDFQGTKVSCGPLGLAGEQDHFFHNNGYGKFTDVSVKAGVSDAKGYYGFASTFVDVDDDGWVDVAVANDSRPNYLKKSGPISGATIQRGNWQDYSGTAIAGAVTAEMTAWVDGSRTMKEEDRTHWLVRPLFLTLEFAFARPNRPQPISTLRRWLTPSDPRSTRSQQRPCAPPGGPFESCRILHIRCN
jgi:hypothetical protein